VTGHDLGGGLLFAVIVVGASLMIRWLAKAMLTYEPHCVYRIPLTDGRPYYGHAKDPDKRIRWHRTAQIRMADGNPRKWWDLVPADVRDARPLVMPDAWIIAWYRSKAVAEQMEQRRIRDDEARGVITANVIKYRREIRDDV
jgi:hypothetical protein